MLSKLFKMNDRYLEIHLSSSRGRIARSIKIRFFALLFIILLILSALTTLIISSIFYFNSLDIDNEKFEKYKKEKIKESNSTIDFINPVKNENSIISQGIKPGHNGIDIVSILGDNVYASAMGQVLYSGFDAIYGNIVILSHQNNFYTFYGHLDTILVSAHNFVKSGEVIGLVGESGMTDGPHLHFEIWGQDGLKDPSRMGLDIQSINDKE